MVHGNVRAKPLVVEDDSRVTRAPRCCQRPILTLVFIQGKWVQSIGKVLGHTMLIECNLA